VIEVPAAALQAAAAARVTLVIGVVDAGKTTLLTGLAAALASHGDPVGVVDADLGQSSVGPPTTVGLGLVHGTIERLDQAEVVALEFLGVTSPARCLRQTASATARLVNHALEIGCRRVLVDTSGLVEGDLGRALKRLKIDSVAPDLLIALQRDAECEPILKSYAGATRPAIVRLAAVATGQRSSGARRRHREHALAEHLAGAAPVSFDLARVDLRLAPETSGLAVIDVVGALVGLVGREGWTLGLGRVGAVDLGGARLTVETTVDASRVTVIAIGRERFRTA
jgi:polynucleotide 5'-hydroxyl-kinase GRC3/NOL9